MNEELILGIHLIGHDLSISLISSSGEVIFIAEEERYSGIKGGNFIFSPKLIREILMEFNISFDRIYHVAVVGEPEKWPSCVRINLSYNPISRFQHKSLWEEEILAIFPNVKQLYTVNHHLAHAACAFYSSKFEDACVITMDAYGDNETATIYNAYNNKLEKLFSIPFYHSHVYLYEAFATWLGLSGKEKAGKLMGLSSYGKPKHIELVRSFFDEKSPFILSDAFDKTKAKAKNWVNIIEDSIGIRNNNSNEFNQFHKDIASSIQSHFEKLTFDLFKKGQKLITSQNVCCAGGGFYNSVSNGELIKSNLFKNYFFHPIAGDSGLSLGAAQFLASKLSFKRAILSNVNLGSKIDTSNFTMNSLHENYTIVEYYDIEELVVVTAAKIAEGNIVGWCQANMEVGPRALGNRSILADPRNKDNISKINKIKNREQWRPFASSVLYEDVKTYFDIDGDYPFMNVVAKILRPEIIPASCHVDGTSRIQTVKPEDNTLYYELINAFKAITGVGVLLNTSLNVQGKPIARDLNDCIEFFESGQVDIIVINNYLITRSMSDKVDLSIKEKKIPIEISCKLDSKFNLIILSPEKKKSELCDILKYFSKDSLIFESKLSIGLKEEEKSLNDFIQFPVYEQLVVTLPWYTEVIEKMMPRLMVELSYLTKKYSNFLIIDIEGKIFLNSSDQSTYNYKSNSSNMTEVEDHYLNLILENHATIF